MHFRFLRYPTGLCAWGSERADGGFSIRQVETMEFHKTETARNGINEFTALTRLTSVDSFTVAEIFGGV